MLCSRCNNPLEPQWQVCPRCGLQQPYSQTVSRVLEKGYGWGKFQGWLLIFGGLVRLGMLHTVPKPLSLGLTLAAIGLGVCIVRRNRLIVPVLIGVVLVQLFCTLSLLHNRFDIYWRVPLLVVFWSACLVYYLRREEEFVAI